MREIYYGYIKEEFIRLDISEVFNMKNMWSFSRSLDEDNNLASRKYCQKVIDQLKNKELPEIFQVIDYDVKPIEIKESVNDTILELGLGVEIGEQNGVIKTRVYNPIDKTIRYYTDICCGKEKSPFYDDHKKFAIEHLLSKLEEQLEDYILLEEQLRKKSEEKNKTENKKKKSFFSRLFK
ncbi:hypothetical protein JDW21_18980 [Bacillus subtilis]|uniref:hypothetical protein n=1 Tax=Bacillus subtilis TaxID=1423 RepID=UPI002ED65ECF